MQDQSSRLFNLNLIAQITRLASDERRIGVEILELLQEIERRKAYAELGYDGLFSFCVKELRYSEAQAYRRIQAMRAVRELPELRQKIKSGALTVTTVSQVQTHLRREAKTVKTPSTGDALTRVHKLELFQSIENQSAKQVEQKIKALSGATDEVPLTLRMDAEMQKSWDQIKNRTAHSTHGRPEAILNMLMQEWLKRNATKVGAEESAGSLAVQVTPVQTTTTSAKKDMLRQKSRYIKVVVKRQIHARDQGQCQNCGSRFAIQIDHRIPYAKGGASTPDNLRLLCRSCNLHQGIKHFGTDKMRRF